MFDGKIGNLHNVASQEMTNYKSYETVSKPKTNNERRNQPKVLLPV